LLYAGSICSFDVNLEDYKINIPSIAKEKLSSTAKIKVESKGSKIYNLNGITVSDSHIVKLDDKWIPVSKHPNAKRIAFYEHPYLYCLNTSNKTILIDDILFTDWDEIVNNEIIELKNNGIVMINKVEDIHKYLDGGFTPKTMIHLKNGTTRPINAVEVGDILENGEIVYGLVEVYGEDLSEQCVYSFTKRFDGLGKNILIEGGPNLNICDKNCIFNTTLNLDYHDKNINYYNTKDIKKIREKKLFHLLTNKKTFYVDKIKFYDYNASVDLFLEKTKIIFISNTVNLIHSSR
jgi:hypothetical protein